MKGGGELAGPSGLFGASSALVSGGLQGCDCGEEMVELGDPVDDGSVQVSQIEVDEIGRVDFEDRSGLLDGRVVKLFDWSVRERLVNRKSD